jgi:hypothetical protein
MIVFHTGDYEIEYCNSLITISRDNYYCQIIGKETVAVFDVFTDECTNVKALDKYFEVAKLLTNGD